MIRHSLLCFVMMSAVASVARGQVAISYSPTTLEPGVATELTMTLTDTSGDVGDFTAIILTFELSDGVTLSGFRWIPDEFANTQLWSITVDIDGEDGASQQAAAVAFASGLDVDSGGSVDVAVLTVTAAANAAGTSQTITAVPDGSDATITDANVATLEVDSGATFTVTVNQADDGDGGSPGNGGGGTPPDTDPGDSTDNGDGDTPDEDDPDATNGDGNDENQTPGDDDTTDPDLDQDAGGPDAMPDDDVTVDDDPGAGSPEDDTDDGDGDTVATGDADGSIDDEPADDATTGTMPFCGPGMIGPGLFTFALLSVMKLHRRRRW